MEYLISLAIAASVNLGVLTWREHRIRQDVKDDLVGLIGRVELVETRLTQLDETVPKKVIATIAPVTHAVRELQQQIGV